jgi:hypothetical protein
VGAPPSSWANRNHFMEDFVSAHQPTVVRGLVCALALGAVLAAVAAGPALAAIPSEAASQIRQIEDSGASTTPTPHLGFTGGTFDASTGVFAGTKTTDGATATTVQRSGGLISNPVVGAESTSVAISAFPTGGKGSGTEATCDLWGGQLQYDQGGVEAAVHNNDLQQYQDAKAKFDDDYNDALDAGCAVID